MTRTLEDIYDALTEVGIFLGDRDERDALACRLTKEGATGETVHLLARHCRRTYGDDFAKRTGSLARILNGPWQQQTPDLQAYEQKEKERASATPKQKKGKVEPGLNERVSNQATLEQLTADWYGMSLRELQHFKYRWVCAEWFNKGYTAEQCCAPQPRGMGCTADELRAWSVEFPRGRTLEDALAIHSGKATAEDVEAQEVEDAKKLAKVKAATLVKNKTARDRQPAHDTSLPWTRNEYSRTSDAKREAKRRLNDANPS